MRVTLLVKRLLGSPEALALENRGRFVDDLLREGWEPNEIRAAFDCLDSDGPIVEHRSPSASFRFLSAQERAVLTPKAQALFMRLQEKGFLGPYEAETVAALVARAAPGRLGVRSLNDIIEYVCDSGAELVKLESSSGRRHLN